MFDPRRFVRVPEFPVRAPVFLLGTQGGGLTLLCRMLRRNPAVISAAGGARYFTSPDELQNVYGLTLPFELTGLRFKAPAHPTLSPPRSWSYAARELFAQYRRVREDATPEARQKLLWAIRFSAWRYADDPDRFRFLDKSQVFTVRLAYLDELLDGCDPRFVLVPRDPYVSVLRAAWGRAADMRRYSRFLSYEERVDICAEHFGNSMRSVREDQRLWNIPVYRLRFEDLLADPEPQLRAICNFTDLPFDRQMLPQAHHRLPWGTRSIERWYPLNSKVNAPYEACMDALTVDRVNHHCGDLLDWLGYDRR